MTPEFASRADTQVNVGVDLGLIARTGTPLFTPFDRINTLESASSGFEALRAGVVKHVTEVAKSMQLELTEDEIGYLTWWFVSLHVHTAFAAKIGGEDWKIKNMFDLFLKSELNKFYYLPLMTRAPWRFLKALSSEELETFCQPDTLVDMYTNKRLKNRCDRFATMGLRWLADVRANEDPRELVAKRITNPVAPYTEDGRIMVVIEVRYPEHDLGERLKLTFDTSKKAFALSDPAGAVSLVKTWMP
jgi:hypothetical protein